MAGQLAMSSFLDILLEQDQLLSVSRIGSVKNSGDASSRLKQRQKQIQDQIQSEIDRQIQNLPEGLARESPDIPEGFEFPKGIVPNPLTGQLEQPIRDDRGRLLNIDFALQDLARGLRDQTRDDLEIQEGQGLKFRGAVEARQRELDRISRGVTAGDTEDVDLLANVSKIFEETEQNAFGVLKPSGDRGEKFTESEKFQAGLESALADIFPGEFEESQQIGSIGASGFAGSVLGNIAPSAAALINPSFLPVVIAGAAGRQASGTLEETDSIATAIGAGTIEAATEFIGLDRIGKIGREAASSVGQALLSGNRRAAFEAVSTVLATSGVEAAEEQVNLIGQEILKVGTGIQSFDKAVENIRGATPQTLAGGALGGALLAGPAVVGGAIANRSGQSPQSEPTFIETEATDGQETQAVLPQAQVIEPPSAVVQQQQQSEISVQVQPSSRPANTVIHRHQAGFVDLTPLFNVSDVVIDTGTKTVSGAARATKALTDLWSKPLIRVVEDQAAQAGKSLANKSRRAVDSANQVVGQLEPELKPFLNAASGKTLRSRRAVNRLNEIDWDQGGEFGFSRFQSAVEGVVPDAQLSEAELDIVQRYRGLIRSTGLLAENRGLEVKNPDQPGDTKFKSVEGGKRLIRRPTDELFRILRQDESSFEFQRLSKILAQANEIDTDESISNLREIKERSANRLSPMESLRKFKRFPTHIRIGLGNPIPLLVTTPFSSGQHLVNVTATRLGFIDQFGQDLDGQISQGIINDFVREGGKEKDASNLLMSLNGIPIETPITEPGTSAHEAARFGSAVLSIVRTGLLSRSAIVNIPESLGNTVAFIGARRYLPAMKDLALNPFSMATETARMGLRTVNMVDLTIDPARRIESFARIARDVGLRVVGNVPVNELNELHAAVAGLIMAGDLKAGRGTAFDEVRLDLMGFTKSEVKQLMSGQATDDQYMAVAARATEFTQGTTSSRAQRSRRAQSRIANTVIAFDSYGQMKFDRMARVNRQWFKDVSNAKNRPAKALASSLVAAEFYLGTTASGVAAIALRALALGGFAGLWYKWDEAKADPDGFAAEATAYAMLSGPIETLARASRADDSQTLARDLIGTALPGQLMMDMTDFFHGSGRYKNKSVLEKTETFLSSNLPIQPVVANVMAWTGLGSKDVKLQAAMGSYFKWRRDNKPFGRSAKANNAQTKRFRLLMRRASDELKSVNGDPGIHLKEALETDGVDRRKVASSLRARKLLRDLSEEETAELRRSIGEDAFDQIVTYDRLLESWARYVQ